MKKLSLLTTLCIIIVACNENGSNDNGVINIVKKDTTTKTIENPLDSIHPNNLSEDLSWIVGLDIQEGFLLSYTITYQSGNEITKKVKELDVGGVDHPEPHFINDTTYFVPNMGASKNGHYEMYIYYSGRAEYKEVITSK